MRINIKDGTRTKTNRCDTCRNAQIMKGAADSERIVFCHAMSAKAPNNVSECSSYRDRLERELWEFEQIAWILEQGGGRKVGFKPPEDTKHNPRYPNLPRGL